MIDFPSISPKIRRSLLVIDLASLAIGIWFNVMEPELQKLPSTQGKSNREIAIDLHLTEGTVKNYVTNILAYLNLRDRLQVALWVAQNLTDVDRD